MEKSKKDALGEDGLSTLKYKLLEQRYFPLYTWLHVQLPPAPTAKPASALQRAGNALWGGMAGLAGGLAKKVANGAAAVASARDEEHEMMRNHVY